MRIGWSTIAGFGVAGLLVASPFARAQGGSSTTQQPGSTTSGTGSSGSTTSGTGSSGSTTSGTESGSSTGSSSSGSTTGSSSGSTMGGTGTSAGAMGAENQVSGKIQKIDKDTHTLTLDNSDKKLKLSSKTQVMKDGTKGTAKDLKEGQDVRASYAPSKTGDTLDVTMIEVLAAGAPGSTGSSGSMGGSTTTPGGTGTTGGAGSTGGTTGTTPGGTGSSGSTGETGKKP